MTGQFTWGPWYELVPYRFVPYNTPGGMTEEQLQFEIAKAQKYFTDQMNLHRRDAELQKMMLAEQYNQEIDDLYKEYWRSQP